MTGLGRLGFSLENGVLGLHWQDHPATLRYDAIILDLSNLHQTGLDFVAACRSESNNIPILLLTTVDGVQERVRWLDAGVDACLVKPFDLDEMAARLRALIRRRADHQHVEPSNQAWSTFDCPLPELVPKAGLIARRSAMSVALLAGMVFLGSARAQELRVPLSPEQRQAIGEAEQAKALAQYRSQLLSSRGATIIGNPNGRVSLVAFFDYNCPYCRASAGDIQKLVDANPELRVVLREFPILGPDSTATSRLALAVAREAPDIELRARYYDALMKAKGSMTGSLAFTTATSMGLDSAKLKSDLKDPEIDAILRENFAAAEALGVNGTPAFIIGDQVIVGAVGADRMQATLSAAAAVNCCSR